jgi:hypothetical protein
MFDTVLNIAIGLNILGRKYHNPMYTITAVIISGAACLVIDFMLLILINQETNKILKI